jgi:hypothetical protein
MAKSRKGRDSAAKKLRTRELGITRFLWLVRFSGYGVSLPIWLLILNELETTVKLAVAKLS